MQRVWISVLVCAVVLPACAGGAGPADDVGASPVTATDPAATRTRTHKLASFPAPPEGTLPAATAESLQAVLDAAVDRGVPGATAAVIAAGRGSWSGAAGTSGGDAPLTPRSQFGIGSITKTVVAAEVLRLAENGRLRLDDAAAEHLPSRWDFDTNGATIGDLLAMESGIPDTPLLAGSQEPDRVWQPVELLAGVPPARSDPGEVFVYTNVNYVLLGEVVRHVTGHSVATALRAHVTAHPQLSPLVYQPEERPRGPLALPFRDGDVRDDFAEGGGYLPTKAEAGTAGAAGAMASNAPALALWAYLLFGGQLLSESSLSAMTDFGNDGYGLGVYDLGSYFGDLGVEAVGNGGWFAGYSTVVSVLPEQGLVISVLANTDIDPRDLVLPIAAELAAAL